MTDPTIRMTDRLVFWVVLSGLAALLLGPLAFGTTNYWMTALATLIVTPLVASTILAVRAVVRGARGRPADLHIFGKRWIRGQTAIVAPILTVVGLLVLREAGVYQANLYRSRAEHTSRWSQRIAQSSASAPVIDGVPADDPSWAVEIAQLSVVERDDKFAHAIQEQLSGVGLPAGTTLAEVRIDGDSPSAWTPLYKNIECNVSLTVSIQIKRSSGHLRWVCDYERTHSETIVGLFAANDVPEQVGKSIGQSLAQILRDKLPEWEGALAD